MSAPKPPPNREDVIDRIYDVALDPTRLEDLLDRWESLVTPPEGGIGQNGLDDGMARHIARASQMMERLQHEQPSGSAALLLPFDKVAALLIDDTGRITELNGAARTVLGAAPGDALTVLRIDVDDLAELSRRAREMCLGGEQPEQVIRVRSAEDNRFILFHMRRCYVPEAGPHVLAATSETAWPDGFDDLLKGSFGLTSAEVDVVRQIVECQSVKDIAEARGRSVDTVRVQVKSILSKTEAHSQSELVRLALSLMDMATVDQTAMPERPATRTLSLEPRPFQTLWTATGRRLDYVTFGDPAGRPLLYLHGAYGLCRWSPAAEQRAAQKGLRVIVPIRAGYGATDLVPRDADYAHMQTADLIQVMDAEGVTRAPVVTMGSDIYFAVWLAHFHPTRVSHILGGGPSLPLTRPEQFERMEKWHRFVNAGARYTPKVLPFIVKAGFLLARRLGKRGFIHAVHGDVPGDVAVFENPDIFPAFEFGTDIALSATHAAHDAFSQQAIAHQTSDWRSALEGLESKVPVIALFGDDDPEMPPETLAELQSDYPWLDWRIKPNVGQLVLFRYLFDIIDEFAPA